MNAKKNTTELQTTENLAEISTEIATELAYNSASTDYAQQEQFLMDYNHCCLCGDELIFSHVTNFVKQEVKEEAHCPSCKIRTKEQSHSLQ